jgi:hypothetical protein
MRYMIGVLAMAAWATGQTMDEQQIQAALGRREPVPGDQAVAAAAKLGLNMPVMCREWHVWWGAPYGNPPQVPVWTHWKGFRKYGTFDPAATIEEPVLGSAWRRHLNGVGYPLLGPYDAGQPDIVRWQLETAKRAGLTCLHLHLWPSIWDQGEDFTPQPVLDIVLDQAAKLDFPIAIHDEIQFRRPNITKAQTLQSTIRRTTRLLARYKDHPGFYKIKGMPFYYIQNWSNWISAKDMATYFQAVEQAVGPVYWVVEMAPKEDYLAIPELKAYVGPSNSWFLHTPPYGVEPHPWDQLAGSMADACRKARAHGKDVGVLVMSRFDNTHDRGKEGRGRVPAEDGMFLVKSLELAAQQKPDFVVLMQWNDFEECAFIEPGWDFDGFNGDPYRYCRIVASAVGQPFVPASLPQRDQLDPFIRHRLFGDTQPGDAGPVLHQLTGEGRTLRWAWGEGSGAPARLAFSQGSLLTWQADTPRSGLRLSNPSAIAGDGVLEGKEELRFYLDPTIGRALQGKGIWWLAVEVAPAAKGSPRIEYRADMETYRVDSRWEHRYASPGSFPRLRNADGSVVYWVPLHGARPVGVEGDITIKLSRKTGPTVIRRLALWNSLRSDAASPTSWEQKQAALPSEIDPGKPYVVAPYDTVDNPGLPRLVIDGATVPSQPLYGGEQ